MRLAYRQFHQASLTGMSATSPPSGRRSKLSFGTLARRKISACSRPTSTAAFIAWRMLSGTCRCARRWLAVTPAALFWLMSIFRKADYAQARIALETLIDKNRTWDNLARLAHWKGKMGHPDEADRLYAEAEDELTAKELRSFAWLELQRGALAMSRGGYGKARTHYRRAAASFPGHWHTDEHMAGLLATEGDYDEAVGRLRSVVARTPKPELKQALGELLVAMGRTEEAQPWIDAAVAAFLASAQQGGVHYYHHLADVYADMPGCAAEAVKWARRDVALRSNFSTQSALAWALLQNGEVAEGLVWIRQALESGVHDGGIFATAAALFHAAGDTAEGERYAHAAAEMHPGEPHFHVH